MRFKSVGHGQNIAITIASKLLVGLPEATVLSYRSAFGPLLDDIIADLKQACLLLDKSVQKKNSRLWNL